MIDLLSTFPRNPVHRVLGFAGYKHPENPEAGVGVGCGWKLPEDLYSYRSSHSSFPALPTLTLTLPQQVQPSLVVAEQRHGLRFLVSTSLHLSPSSISCRNPSIRLAHRYQSHFWDRITIFVTSPASIPISKSLVRLPLIYNLRHLSTSIKMSGQVQEGDKGTLSVHSSGL